MKVEMEGPVYGGTTVPLARPLVVFGDGEGSYCLVSALARETTTWNDFLPPQIAVLCVRTVAEIGPQTMQSP